ncbi:helix-turn-helix domain-containing protein [Paraclostridium bifermentans]
MKIGIIIKLRRVNLNLTQKQVSKNIFISTKSISYWENDKIFSNM